MQAEDDLLTEALSALRVDSSALVVFDLTAPWGFSADFRQPFSWTVVEGCVWVVAPRQKPMRFDAGDTIILPRGTESGSYSFLSAPDAHAFPAGELWRQSALPAFEPGLRWPRPRVIQWGGGGAPVTRIVSLAFGFHDRRLGPLVEALPERMIVRAGDVNADFLQVLLRFPFGDGPEEPGFPAIATQTAQLLLICLVRTYALRGLGANSGWLSGLADARIAPVLTAIHRQPEHPWTVDRLAAIAGMSRSAFAGRFMDCMGQSPARYVCAWRMHLAREALAAGRTVTELAHSLGYQSEAAFRAAFRRITGQAPRAFQRSVR